MGACSANRSIGFPAPAAPTAVVIGHSKCLGAVLSGEDVSSFMDLLIECHRLYINGTSLAYESSTRSVITVASFVRPDAESKPSFFVASPRRDRGHIWKTFRPGVNAALSPLSGLAFDRSSLLPVGPDCPDAPIKRPCQS